MDYDDVPRFVIKKAIKLLLWPFKDLFSDDNPNAEEELLKNPIKMTYLILLPVIGGFSAAIASEKKMWVMFVLDSLLALAVFLTFGLSVPTYIVFKIFLLIDTLTLVNRHNNGHEIGEWEFFWNKPKQPKQPSYHKLLKDQ